MGRIEGKETLRVGKRGVVVIPASLRRTFHLSEGSVLVAEARAEGATAAARMELRVGAKCAVVVAKAWTK